MSLHGCKMADVFTLSSRWCMHVKNRPMHYPELNRILLQPEDDALALLKVSGNLVIRFQR